MSISLNDHENRISLLEKRGWIRQVLFDARESKMHIMYDVVTLNDNAFDYDFLCIVSGDYLPDKQCLEDTAYTMVDVNILKSSIDSGISCTNIDVNTAQGLYQSHTSMESFNLRVNEDRACIQGYWLNIRTSGTKNGYKNDITTGVCAIIGYKWGGGINLGTLLKRLLVYIKTYSKLFHLQFLEVK